MVEHPSSSSSWQILHCLRYDNGEDGSCSIPSFPAGASCFCRSFMISPPPPPNYYDMGPTPPTAYQPQLRETFWLFYIPLVNQPAPISSPTIVNLTHGQFVRHTIFGFLEPVDLLSLQNKGHHSIEE
jgi:hypothetical protein